MFIAEGDLVVRRALEAGCKPDVVLCDPKCAHEFADSVHQAGGTTLTASADIRREVTGLGVPLDAIGVFGYSDEDKTEALTLADKVDQDVINSRVELLSKLVDEFLMQRAEERIGEHVRVLIEDEDTQEGRAEHQGPEVDGSTFVTGRAKYKVGEYVDAVVTEVSGVDLIAVPL